MAVTNIKCKHQVCKQNAAKVQTSRLSVTCTLSHCCKLQSLSSCCQVQYLEENQGKHCVAGGPTKNLFPASDKHSLTLLQTPEPLTQSLPGPVPGRKQRKTLGWWWSYQEPIPLSVTSILSHCCHHQSTSSCCQVQYLGENKGKHCVGGEMFRHCTWLANKNMQPVS